MGLVEEVRTLPKKVISFNLSLFGSGFAGLGYTYVILVQRTWDGAPGIQIRDQIER